jgi:hypothetical protein
MTSKAMHVPSSRSSTAKAESKKKAPRPAGHTLTSHGWAVAQIAVDLEHHHYRSFMGFTCLMQISTRSDDYLVDLLALRSHVREALGSLFLDEKLLKVFHGADSDVQWLQRDFGIYVVSPCPPLTPYHVPYAVCLRAIPQDQLHAAPFNLQATSTGLRQVHMRLRWLISEPK